MKNSEKVTYVNDRDALTLGKESLHFLQANFGG